MREGIPHQVKHSYTHLEKKPFGCSDCSYAASRRDTPMRHIMRWHIQVKQLLLKINVLNNNSNVLNEKYYILQFIFNLQMHVTIMPVFYQADRTKTKQIFLVNSLQN